MYEGYAQTKLVDTGKMPPRNLHVYQDMTQAVSDLKAGRIEAVWLDLLPAQDFVSSGGVKIAAQGLNQQLYGIALKKGATALQDKINEALTTLQNNGTIAKLAQQYLKESPRSNRRSRRAQPTPAPPQPTPATTCLCGWRGLGGRPLVQRQ